MPQAVFISYASQDAAAAQRIADGLAAAGVEVWLDKSELAGGDQWDAKIRRQIADCRLLVPVISAATQQRREGYFRLEWKLAAQRTHMMSERAAFLLPVVVDDTGDAEADVPGEFRAVQWTRLPGGRVTAAFQTRVQELLANADAAPAAPPGVGAAMGPATASRARRKSWGLGLAAALLLGAAGAAVFALKRPRPAESTPRADSRAKEPIPADDRSVAVLAFVNSSPDRDTEYFSDGVSEEILNTLANQPGLRVAARTSSFSFKGRNVPIAEIGRALNVAKVIEGSVRRAGDTVRVTVKLINVADGFLVWSQTLERRFAEIFSVQSEIAAQVLSRFGALPPAAGPARNPAAYDLYLRGRAQQLAGNGPLARRFFEQALEIDANYAVAWARIAHTHMRVILGGYDRSEVIATRARTAVARALQLEPRLPEALLADATLRLGVDYDFEGAEHALKEAERLRPNEPEVPLLRAMLAQARGLWNQSLVGLARRVEELDPQNTESLERLGLILQRAGQFSEADRLFGRCVSLSANRDAPYRFRAANHAAWTGDTAAALAILESAPVPSRATELYPILRGAWLVQRGDLAAAAAEFERARNGDGRSMATGPRIWRARATYRLARLEAQLGHETRAKELLAEAAEALRRIDQDAPNLVRTPYERALIFARQGDRAAALAALEESERRAARNGDAYETATVKLARAEMLATLGEAEPATAVLLALHKMGYGFGHSLQNDTEWEALRGHDSFRRLAKEAGLRASGQK